PPIRKLTAAASELAGGKSVEPLPIQAGGELGQMSSAFNQMTDAIKTQRRLRKRLIADVSHELGTPLSVIRLEAKALGDGMQSPQEASMQIQREVDMLKNLVQDLSWLAETDEGELALSKEPMVVSKQLKDLRTYWRTQASTHGVALDALAVRSDLIVDADPIRITQILGNLIRNSMQHTHRGGAIELSARRTTLPGQTGAWIVVSVRDSGAGIAADDLPHVFERFYRADQARNRNGGGRGLGLSIVQQLVSLHGGLVWVESDLGRGSAFHVALPD
ncbi:MAG: HAMP domain-containing histidine kinase, partial [Methylococcales bacterium]|nr:HAMP domain-containing histidine kinase [Methylococcales bacterium]